MPASTPPFTPESSSPNPFLARRASAVSSRIDTSRPRANSSPGPSENVETLYNCSFAKVVSFTANPPPGTDGVNKEGQGTLSAGTLTERTMAAGPLRIYRVPSSGVSFLNSGSLLHPILPRSQAWCIDGQAKFVLRVRMNSYYRIELPWTTQEEKDTTEEFKSAFDKTLRFEKTPCPFRRGFTVELPQEAEQPVRRRKRAPTARPKRWSNRFSGVWEPEDMARRRSERPTTPSEADTSFSYEDDDTWSVATGSSRDQSPCSTTRSSVGEITPPAPRGGIQSRIRRLTGSRAVTAPPELLPQAMKPPAAPPSIPERRDLSDDRSLRHAPSIDSFYSIIDGADDKRFSSHSSSETASIYDDALPGLEDPVPRIGRSHKRQVSELTVTADDQPDLAPDEGKTPTVSSSGLRGPSGSSPSTPTLISDSEDSFEPPLLDVPTPRDTIRLRRLDHHRHQSREISPMPHPANLFTPAIRQTPKNLPITVVQKTYELLTSPPSQLVQLMLRIAARIVSGGGLGFDTLYVGKEPKTPGAWESSGEEDNWGEEEEDDFGVPLHNLKLSSSNDLSSDEGCSKRIVKTSRGGDE